MAASPRLVSRGSRNGPTRRIGLLAAALTVTYLLLRWTPVSSNTTTSARNLRDSARASITGLNAHRRTPARQADYEPEESDDLFTGRTVSTSDDDESIVVEDNIAPIPAVGADDEEWAYRRHLEANASPYEPWAPELVHTMGFSHIYVLSLAKRTDRRERMNKLARALGIRITFVDAQPKDSEVITWIGEQAAEVRRQKRKYLAEAFGVPSTHVGGQQIGSMWLDPSRLEGNEKSKPDDPLTGSRMTRKPSFRYPSLADGRFEGRDWVEYLETTPVSAIHPEDPNHNVTEAMWDPLEDNSFRQLNDAVHSTWYSQTRVLELMRENDDEMALVLEDDVDMEWDIHRMWPNVYRKLPKAGGKEKEWEVLFMGHCWGREQSKPAHMHPLLHPSSEPRCLHAWALSRKGYNKLIKIMRDPWMAYQTAIDTAIPRLIRDNRLEAYSVDPPIVIQSKDTPSDIQGGAGSPWRGHLADSTLERIRRDEGQELEEVTWEEAQLDPASKTQRLTPDKADAQSLLKMQENIALHKAARRTAKKLDLEAERAAAREAALRRLQG